MVVAGWKPTSVDIGIGRRHVPGLEGQEPHDRLSAQMSFQGGDEVQQGHGLRITDIVDSIRGETSRRIGTGAVPSRIGRGGTRRDPDDPFDDVVDIGEVPLHFPLVVDVDGLAGQDGPGEKKQRHVGTSPGAVNGEKAESRAGDPVENRISMGHEFVGFFRGGIETHGMIDVVVNGEGHLGVAAVNGTGGGEDEMGDAVVAAAFQDVQESGKVAVEIGVGIGQGVAHARLGGQMDYQRRFFP